MFPSQFFTLCAAKRLSPPFMDCETASESREMIFPSSLSLHCSFLIRRVHLSARTGKQPIIIWLGVCFGAHRERERAITHICVCRQSVSVSLQGWWIKNWVIMGIIWRVPCARSAANYEIKGGFPFQILWKSRTGNYSDHLIYHKGKKCVLMPLMPLIIIYVFIWIMK
jgi:hypothetical protein